VAVAALVVAILALVFTVSSFWWMNAHRGALQVGRPGAYALVGAVRLRLPLALYNTGATALIVTDIRLVAVAELTAGAPYLWLATLSQLQPKEIEERDFQTPLAVPARGTREVVAEFEGPWCPLPGSERWMRLEAKLHPSGDWRSVGEFDWWAPPPGCDLRRYITYRNAREQGT
jgi:hypothetical protein